MPCIAQEMHKTAGSSYFAEVDFSNSYWQLSLHIDSQIASMFVTPHRVYNRTRVLYGTTYAVVYLYSTLASIVPATLSTEILEWPDDKLIHHESTSGLS